MAQLNGSNIVYVARVSVPKLDRVAGGSRHSFPGGADLAGQGPARGAAAGSGRGRPRAAQPLRAAAAAPLGWRRPPDQLRDELSEVRARGWALADEELAPGVRSVAVPVRDGTGTVRPR